MDTTVLLIAVYLAGVVGHMAFFAWRTWRDMRRVCGAPALCLGALLFPDVVERWSRKVTVAALQDLVYGVVFSILWPMGWVMVGMALLADTSSRGKGRAAA